VDPNHTESSGPRASRELTAFLHSGPFFVWAAIVELGTFGVCLWLGLSGNTKAIGAILSVPVFIGVVLGVLFATAPIRQRNEARAEVAEVSGRASDFDISFSWGRYLQVGVINNGPSLNSALINFLVPATLERIYRLDAPAQPAATGTQISTSEQVAPGVPAIYWQEANIQLPGFGMSTVLYFLLPRFRTDDDEIPVSFRIGGDELGCWLAFNLMVGPPPKPVKRKKENEDAAA
jgi:hypothetical protein